MSLRLLKWLVVGMGVLIVLGTVALAVAIVQRLGGAAGTPGGGPGVVSLGQPAGSRIAAIAGAGERLAIQVEHPDGGMRVLLVDPRSGRVVGELQASPD